MASTKFLEEALSSTDVDESAVSAMVCSLENQLVTSTPTVSQQSNIMTGINQNHVNCSLSNGGTNSVSAAPQQQKLNSVSNGATSDTLIENKTITTLGGNIISGAAAQAATVTLQQQINSVPTNATTNFINNQTLNNLTTKPGDNVKIVYSQVGQAMTSAGTVLTNSRVAFPNGAMALPTINQQQQTTTNVQTIQTKPPQQQQQQQTIVIKSSSAQGVPSGIVTVPMNVSSTLSQVNSVGSPSSSTAPTVLSNLQIVNVRTSLAQNQQQQSQPQKGTTRLMLSAPPMVGARPGGPQQLTFHGLTPGQTGHLLLKTENGQYHMVRVGPAPTAVSTGLTQNSTPLTIKFPTSAPLTSTTAGTTTVTTPNVQVTTPVQSKPVNDNTKEKCRKFLANLLELSSREPRTVERNVRTLIQELIDARVEPEDFCDRLERLLNASPQPCLIGFLKKSLPLLRHALATKELSIEGIRPPPANVVISMVGTTNVVQSQIRPVVSGSQVRVVAPGTTVVRPGTQMVQQRLMTPVRGALQPGTRMLTTIRPPNSSTNVIVSNSQPPALHPVYPSNQIRPGTNVVRQPIQVRTLTPGQIRSPLTVRTGNPLQVRQPIQNYKLQGSKPAVPSVISKSLTKDKDKKSFSSAYTGDDDINDVAAMGGVNLAEESQRILGSTEFVGTQIRSCKEEYLLNMPCLQQRIKSRLAATGLDESSHEIAAVISHATQEKLKNMLEKLAIITEHRLEIIKSDPRYEMTSDIKGQLKFLEDIDRAEKKRHEESEREILLRAAKSRSKTEDPEQAKLKAKAKEMQRVEMEELRQKEANATALQAIGPRKRPRLAGDVNVGSSQSSSSGFNNMSRSQLPIRARTKKATIQDLQHLLENEKDTRLSTLLYMSYLK